MIQYAPSVEMDLKQKIAMAMEQFPNYKKELRWGDWSVLKTKAPAED